MAARGPNKAKANGTTWQKGQCGNPGGRPLIVPDFSLLKVKYTRAEFGLKLQNFLNASFDELKVIRDNPTTSAFDYVMTSMILAAGASACPVRTKLIWDRLIGPVPTTGDSSDGTMRTMVQSAMDMVAAEHYAVRINAHGKFETARPRIVEVLPEKATGE